MKCRMCGCALTKRACFCPSCGAPVDGEETMAGSAVSAAFGQPSPKPAAAKGEGLKRAGRASFSDRVRRMPTIVLIAFTVVLAAAIAAAVYWVCVTYASPFVEETRIERPKEKVEDKEIHVAQNVSNGDVFVSKNKKKRADVRRDKLLKQRREKAKGVAEAEAERAAAERKKAVEATKKKRPSGSSDAARGTSGKPSSPKTKLKAASSKKKTAAEEDKDETAKKANEAYQEILDEYSKYVKWMEVNDKYSGKPYPDNGERIIRLDYKSDLVFAKVDLNNDGIPELLITDSPLREESLAEILTFVRGRAICVYSSFLVLDSRNWCRVLEDNTLDICYNMSGDCKSFSMPVKQISAPRVRWSLKTTEECERVLNSSTESAARKKGLFFRQEGFALDDVGDGTSNSYYIFYESGKKKKISEKKYGKLNDELNALPKKKLKWKKIVAKKTSQAGQSVKK